MSRCLATVGVRRRTFAGERSLLLIRFKSPRFRLVPAIRGIFIFSYLFSCSFSVSVILSCMHRGELKVGGHAAVVSPCLGNYSVRGRFHASWRLLMMQLTAP